jgi:hypothetical protein
MRITKVLAVATLLPSIAFAQALGFITITFGAGSVGVPVGAWLPAMLAGAIGVTAFVLRKKMGGATGAIAAVVAGALVVSASIQMNDASAGIRAPITLVTSPSSTPVDGAAIWSVNNNTGGSIRLTGVSENSVCYDVDTASTTCTVGLTLPAGGSCQVGLMNATPSCQ